MILSRLESILPAQEHPESTTQMLAEATAVPDRPKPVLALIGATQDDSLATQCTQMVCFTCQSGFQTMNMPCISEI